jgi:hypothetical protein
MMSVIGSGSQAPMAEKPIVLPHLNKKEATMLRYLKDHPQAFDPDTINFLTNVLEDAWQVVEANKTTFKVDGDASGARQALAKHIVDLAKQGERDRQVLIEGALTQLKL